MLQCPYCHHSAISYARKSCLGPALSTSCAHCGKQVSVSWFAMLAGIPFLASMPLATHFGFSWQAALVVLVGFGMTFAAHEFLVPLVPRGT